MTICVVDLETTGLDPATADIVELGIVTIPDLFSFQRLVRPVAAIELRAMATHHITEDMLTDQSSIDEVVMMSPLMEASVLVAHNAGFDRGFIEKSDVIRKLPWVCTWRCAQQLWPEAPFFSNQVLRYWLPGLNRELRLGIGDGIMQLPPHRALPDAWVTAHVLKRMLVNSTIEELVELTKQPILGRVCQFGKHRGVEWSKVPKGYLHWLINKDFDADTIYTAKHYLEQQQEKQNVEPVDAGRSA